MNKLSGFLLCLQNPKLKTFYFLKSFVFLFLLNCAPEKTEVTDLDMHRLIDRISFTRFSDRLETEDSTKIKSDREIFLETCEIYRLNPNTVLDKLKTSHPKLYNRFKDKDEK